MAADTAPDLTLPTAARQHFDAAITMHADIWDTPVSAKGAGPTGDGSRPWITCLSGGADSTALALLADDHARRSGRAHSAIIIDHAIRPEAAQEAARVASRMQAAGIAVSVHKVETVAPATGIQAWARAQRYTIATDIARRSGAALLLGQHAGDQAETVWMRLQRGSGLAGLGGMRAVDWRGGVPLLRPLLGFFRHELEAVCQQAGCGWETDPSNNDRRFERVRARAALASLSGMDSQLRRLAAAASTIDDHLMAAVAASQQAVQLATDGSAMLDRSVLALPQAVFRRVLSRATQIIGGNPHPPTHAALDRLRMRLQAGNASTLGTCRFRPVAGQGWQIIAEIGRNPPCARIKAGETILFAGRWLVTSQSDGIVRPFSERHQPGDDSWRRLAGWQGLSAAVRAPLPVVESLDGTPVYPHLQVSDGKSDTSHAACAVFLPFAAGAGNRVLAGSTKSCAMPKAGVTRNQGAGADRTPAHNTVPLAASGRSMGPLV